MKKRKPIHTPEMLELLENLDFEPILQDKLRQVRWLYNNSNKCTMVYEEKLVRLMLHHAKKKIEELEETVKNLYGIIDEWNQ